MTKIGQLPPPVCELGYPRDQLKEIVGDRLDEFNQWMTGQTGAICTGERYDYHNNETVPSNCGPHGMVVYRHDVQRFLEGRGILDW